MAKQTTTSAIMGFSIKDAIGVFSVVLAALFLQTLLLPLRPFQSDEGTYVYAAYAITKGLIPYREVFMAHPPLMYYAYSAFIKLGGIDIIRIRLFNIVVYLITVLSTFVMAKMLLKDHRKSAALSILCAAVYAFYPSFFLVIAATALLENLLTLFALGSTIAYIWYYRTERKTLLFLAGILMGLSLLTTIRAALFIASILLFDLSRNLWRKNYKAMCLNLGTMLLATLAPSLIVVSILFYLQALPQFYLQAFYTQLILFPQYPDQRLAIILWFMSSMLPIVVTGALGGLYLVRDARKFRISLLVLPVLIPVFVYALLAFAFRSTFMHYFYFLNPYIAFLSTACFGEIASLLRHNSRKKKKIDLDFSLLTTFLALLVVMSCQTFSYASQTTVPYFRLTPYNYVDLYIGRYISNVTSTSDKIWTSDAAIGFFADRLIVAPCNSGWPFRAFYSSALGYSFNMDRASDMKDHKEGLVSTQQLVQAWEKERIKAIVFIHGPGWIPFPDDLIWNGFRDQSGVAEYVEANYELRLIANNPTISYVYYVWVRK